MAKLLVPETMSTERKYLGHEAEYEGIYHFIASDVLDSQRPGKDDALEMMDGFTVIAEVIHGPHAGKKHNFILFDGSLTHADEGKSARRKQAAMLIACDAIKPDSLGKEVEYDLADCIGSQFCANLKLRPSQDKTKQFLDLSYADIWHVDDPRAKKVAKSATSLSEIPAENRHKPEYFNSLIEKRATQTTAKKPATSEFDDI